MGNKIVKMPNGKYGVFSSIVDAFTMVDCSAKDIIEDWLMDSRDRITRQVNRQISEAKPDDFMECVFIVASVHGPEGLAKLAEFLGYWKPTINQLAWAKKWNNPEIDGIWHWEYEDFVADRPVRELAGDNPQ